MSVNTRGETIPTVTDLLPEAIDYASGYSVVTIGESYAGAKMPSASRASRHEVIVPIWEVMAKRPSGLEQYP